MIGEYVYPGKLYNGDMMLGYGLVKKDGKGLVLTPGLLVAR